VLLAIAVGAMVIACILMALEMNSYEWSVKANVALLSPLDTVSHALAGSLASGHSPAV
jgi:hypothetical protein